MYDIFKKQKNMITEKLLYQWKEEGLFYVLILYGPICTNY